MTKVVFNENMLSNTDVFKSLVEDASECGDVFDTVFTSTDEEEFAQTIGDVDHIVADAVKDQMRDASDIKAVITSKNECYITIEEFANFCKYAKLTPVEAIQRICEEVSDDEITVTDSNVNIVISSGFDKCSNNEFVRHLVTNGINVCQPKKNDDTEAVQEGSWSNSTDIDKEKKWYKEFLARVSKNNSESDEEVKARIAALKTCVARMEKCLDDFKKYKNGKGPLKGDSFKDHAEWSFKYIVPTSVFYRLAKYPKVGIGELVLKIGNLATMILGTAGMMALSDYFKIKFNVNPVVPVVIGANLYGIERDYENMLTTQIKETNNAIEYLESTLKQKD